MSPIDTDENCECETAGKPNKGQEDAKTLFGA